MLLGTGCASTELYIGAGVHDNDIDGEQWQHKNTIGIIRVEQPVNEIISVFYQHESSIPDRTDNKGFNMVGGFIRLK